MQLLNFSTLKKKKCRFSFQPFRHTPLLHSFLIFSSRNEKVIHFLLFFPRFAFISVFIFWFLAFSKQFNDSFDNLIVPRSQTNCSINSSSALHEKYFFLLFEPLPDVYNFFLHPLFCSPLMWFWEWTAAKCNSLRLPTKFYVILLIFQDITFSPSKYSKYKGCLNRTPIIVTLLN